MRPIRLPCEVCKKRFKIDSIHYVKDAIEFKGYIMDARVCTKCWKEVSKILDNGTQAFVDWLEARKLKED